MAIIKPCADLRNNYAEISRICHETNQPVYITKNGYDDLVIMSTDCYNNMLEDFYKNSPNYVTEEEVNELLAKEFDKHYKNIEEYQKDLAKNINKALQEIENGKGIPMEEVIAEMEAKYGI